MSVKKTAAVLAVLFAFFMPVLLFYPFFTYSAPAESGFEPADVPISQVFYGASADSSLDVSAESAIIADAESLAVYYHKNPKEKMGMASTTKIMTALLVSENISLDGTFTVPKRLSASKVLRYILKKAKR